MTEEKKSVVLDISRGILSRYLTNYGPKENFIRKVLYLFITYAFLKGDGRSLNISDQMLDLIINYLQPLFLGDLTENGRDTILEKIKKDCFHARVSFMETVYFPDLHELFYQDPLLASYIGRALPFPSKIKIGESEVSTMSRYTISTKRPLEKNLRGVADIILKIPKIGARHLPYSESSCLFSSRRNGGQKGFFSNFVRLLTMIDEEFEMDGVKINPKWDLYQKLERICYLLDKPIIDHLLICDGNCDGSHHFPYKVMSIPEAGMKIRTLLLPVPTLIFMTENLQKTAIHWFERQEECNASLTGHFKLDFEKQLDENRKFYSADFSKATDNFSLELVDLCGSIFASKGDFYENIYAHMCCKPGRLFGSDIKFPDFGGAEDLVPDLIPNIPTVGDFIDDLDTPMSAYFHKQFANELDRPSCLPIKPSSFTLDLYKERLKTEMIDYKSKELGKNPEKYLVKMIEKYRSMISGRGGIEQKRGMHMSLPISFISLLSVNLYAAREAGGQSYIMGDDLILLGLPHQWKRYREIVEDLGLIINEEKTLISENYGLFCERLYSFGGMVEKPRIKKVAMAEKEWHQIWENEPTEAVLELRSRFFLSDIVSAFCSGYDPARHCDYGGLNPYGDKYEFEHYGKNQLVLSSKTRAARCGVISNTPFLEALTFYSFGETFGYSIAEAVSIVRSYYSNFFGYYGNFLVETKPTDPRSVSLRIRDIFDNVLPARGETGKKIISCQLAKFHNELMSKFGHRFWIDK
jgi:hypothetical protein